MYVIVPISEITNTLLNASTTHLLENTRHSLDETLCVLKFDESVNAQYFIDRTWYTKTEIDEIMLTEVWE